MAKVKFSALVSEMRNKLNGSVFSKNRAGNFLRNKVTPVNPQSMAQQAVRAVFGAVSSAWRGLTEVQVNAWNALAGQVPYTDIFGDTKYLSGLQLHQKYNTNLQSVGNAMISNAPELIVVPSSAITAFSVEIDTGAIVSSIDVAGSPNVPAGFTAVIFATPPMGVGISYAKSQLRKIGIVSSSSVLSTEFNSLYANKYGVPAVGSKVFVRIHLVSNTTGQNSVAGSASTVVVSA